MKFRIKFLLFNYFPSYIHGQWGDKKNKCHAITTSPLTTHTHTHTHTHTQQNGSPALLGILTTETKE